MHDDWDDDGVCIVELTMLGNIGEIPRRNITIVQTHLRLLMVCIRIVKNRMLHDCRRMTTTSLNTSDALHLVGSQRNVEIRGLLVHTSVLN